MRRSFISNEINRDAKYKSQLPTMLRDSNDEYVYNKKKKRKEKKRYFPIEKISGTI